MSLDPKKHEQSRKLILEQLAIVKKNLIICIQGGSRDFKDLMDLVNEYIDLQYTSDVLSGQTKVG